jgi:hypothetical protein
MIDLFMSRSVEEVFHECDAGSAVTAFQFFA